MFHSKIGLKSVMAKVNDSKEGLAIRIWSFFLVSNMGPDLAEISILASFKA